MARILQAASTPTGTARSLTAPTDDSQSTYSPSPGVTLKTGQTPGFGALKENLGELATYIPGQQVLGEIGNSLSGLGTAAKQAVTGNFGGAGQTLQNATNKQHPIQTVGDVAQTVGTAATFAGVGGLGTLGRIGLNAAEGGLIGGGNTAAKGGSITDTLKGAGLGAAAGGAIAGGLEAPGIVRSLAKSKVPGQIDSLEAKYQELAGSTTRTSKILAKGQAATDAKNLAGTTGKTPARTLAEAGVIPAQEGSKLKTLAQADQFKQTIQPLHDTLGTAIKSLSHDVAPVPMDALQTSAIHRVMNQNVPEGDKIQLINGIKKEFGNLRNKFGDRMTIQEMNDSKPAYWGGTKFNSTKPFQGDVYYQVGKSFQKGIEGVAKNGGFEDVAQLNREIGDRLEASKFLADLNDKVVKGGRFQKYVFQGIGAAAGATHGPLGSIVGSVLGDHAANMLINNTVASPVKRLILSHLQQENPAVYTKALKWLEAHGQARDLQLKLPAQPELGTVGNPRTFSPPRPDISGARSVPAAQMKGPGITPKGKFTKVYGNSPE